MTVLTRETTTMPSIPSTGRQIEDEIVAGIASGAYPPGTQLPTYVALAERHGVSEQTVYRVYQRLLEAGRVVSRPGRGMFVPEADPP